MRDWVWQRLGRAQAQVGSGTHCTYACSSAANAMFELAGMCIRATAGLLCCQRAPCLARSITAGHCSKLQLAAAQGRCLHKAVWQAACVAPAAKQVL